MSSSWAAAPHVPVTTRRRPADHLFPPGQSRAAVRRRTALAHAAGAGAPHGVRLPVAPADLVDLPHRLAGLVDDVRAGSAAVVDVGAVEPTPAHLGLLLSVLWRRVGPYGSVALAGASEHQQATWRRLGVAPEQVRVRVYGHSRPLVDPRTVEQVAPAQRVPSAAPAAVPAPA